MRIHDIALVLLLTGCGREDAVRTHLEDHEGLRDIELRHTGDGTYIYTARGEDASTCQGEAQADGIYLGCVQQASISSRTSCVQPAEAGSDALLEDGP